ncbi:hypothetical protein WR25_23948 [Diploscapter pachys]|uniref:Tyrosinase copper-binding domain-containing protein n=1 Tax=Diploscapter pachys TaxID=2018661 RepID=A0A2A2JLU7_9BILA|nr:hypothetical protein WR25_23948 [Diploscapter pachys]
MDRMTRRRLTRQIPGPAPQQAATRFRGLFSNDPYECMTLICLCPFFQGIIQENECILSTGYPLGMAWRKEYRLMTEDERNRYHNALNALKRNGVYDWLSRIHLEVSVGSGAHSGPGFLPWHREFLKRFEIALRLIDPYLAIPYFDSVMDSYLPDPRDSIVFSDLFVGQTDAFGNVVTGPFAYWPTLEGRPTISRHKTLKNESTSCPFRALGQEGQLLTEAQVNNIVAQNTIENTLAFTAPQVGCPYRNNYGAIEYVHSSVHLWIGGNMKPPSTSANDPIFFVHHSFVDYLFELWRQMRQPREYRETVSKLAFRNIDFQK